MSYCCHCNSSIRSNASVCPACGKMLIIDDRYKLIKRIGAGGFGTVFEGVHIKKHYQCAIKQIQFSTPEERIQIETEVSILKQRLGGLSFVPVIYGAWQYHSTIYIVMQYIDGHTLDKFSADAWIPDRVERFLNVMLSQLSLLHNAKVIHRDIKPSNIIRTPDKSYVLIDFGISKQGSSTRTVMRGVGTIDYIPLEQLRGEPTTPQSDLYSLGATAYHLLTGHLPPAIDRRLAGIEPQRPSNLVVGVSHELDTTIMNILALRQEKRPRTASEALGILNKQPPRFAVASQSILAHQRKIPQIHNPNNFPQQGRESFPLGGLVTLVFIVIFIALIITMSKSSSGRPNSATAIPIATREQVVIGIIAAPIAVIPASDETPDQFIQRYYSNVNNRQYEDSFSLLSENFTPRNFDGYVKFWDTIIRVDVLSMDIQDNRDGYAKIFAKLLYYRQDSTCIVSDVYFTVLHGGSDGSWQIERADSTQNQGTNCPIN